MGARLAWTGKNPLLSGRDEDGGGSVGSSGARRFSSVWTTAFDEVEDMADKAANHMKSVWEHDLQSIAKQLHDFRSGFASDFAAIDRASLSTLRSMATGFNSLGSISREQIRMQSAGVTAQMGLERQRFTESERMAREGLRTAAQVEREKERLAGLRSVNEQRLARETARTLATVERERLRTATVATREYGRQERERLRVTTATARSAVREYEKELGAGFFSRLGSSATAAFKRTFGVTGKGAQAGGSFLGNAASVATGNLITGAITGAIEQVQEGISSGMDFNRLREATMLGLRRKLGERDAGRFFDEVAQFAQVESPLKIPQATAQANRLLALNFKRDEIIPLLRAAGDAAAGMGLVGEDAEQKVVSITKALSDMKGKQRVNAEELSRQLQESGVAGWRYIAEELQRQYPKLSRLSEEQAIAVARDMAEHNRLDANAAISAIVRGMQREFGGTGKDINLNTLVGQEAMTEDNMSVIMGKATESLFRHKLVGQKALNQALQGGAAERLAGYVSAGTDATFTTLENGLRSLGVDLPKLGAEAGGSYATGFKSSAAEAHTAGAAVAGAAERGIRDKNQQHSPSQLMLDLGYEAAFSYVQGFNRALEGEGGRATRAQIDRYVREAAERFKVPAELIHAVIDAESSYKQYAVSHAGAKGLMQLMPGTARRFGVENSFDARQNIMGGTKYLSELLKMFDGEVRLALAAYNAGEGRGRSRTPEARLNKLITENIDGVGSYVSKITNTFARLQGHMDGLSASAERAAVSLPPLKDFFSQFVGKGYAPGVALGHSVPDRPRSGDLAGGVGYFASDFNPRGFAERLYDLQKSMPAGGRTSVQAQADWAHTVSLLAEEFHISRAVQQKIEGMVAQRIEDERRALSSLSAQGAAEGGSFRPGSTFANITPEQAREALKIATGSARELKQETVTLATSITPQALASVKLLGGEAREAFQEVLPLVKDSGEEAERFAKRVSNLLSTYFGGALNAALRRDWRSFFEGLRDDAIDFVSKLAKDQIQKRIYSALSPKQSLSVDGGGGGGLPGFNVGGAISGGRSGGFLGAIKGLFGFGGAGAAASSAAPSSALPALTSAVPGAGISSVFGAGAGAAVFGGGAGAASGVGAGAASGSAAAGTSAGASSGIMGLMLNPWTIGIAAAALGGFALWKAFSHKTEKELRKVIQSEYALNVRDMKTLSEVKAIGESVFGRGKVRENLLGTVRLDPVKDLLTSYAEATGQTASKLVTAKELANASDPRNQFIRRIDGGAVPGVTRGYDHVRALLDGGEHVIDSRSVARNGGHAAFDALRAGDATITPRGKTPLARVMERLRERMKAQEGERSSGSSPSPTRSAGGRQSGGMSPALSSALVEALNRNAESNERLERKLQAMRPGEFATLAADENPEAFARGTAEGLKSGSVRQKTQEALGMRQ